MWRRGARHHRQSRLRALLPRAYEYARESDRLHPGIVDILDVGELSLRRRTRIAVRDRADHLRVGLLERAGQNRPRLNQRHSRAGQLDRARNQRALTFAKIAAADNLRPYLLTQAQGPGPCPCFTQAPAAAKLSWFTIPFSIHHQEEFAYGGRTQRRRYAA